MDLTPRQRVEQALRGGHSDRVPFTMYECMIPQCVAEREMRNRGLCIVQREVTVFKKHYPNVRICEQSYWEDDRKITRRVYETPKGNLSAQRGRRFHRVAPRKDVQDVPRLRGHPLPDPG